MVLSYQVGWDTYIGIAREATWDVFLGSTRLTATWDAQLVKTNALTSSWDAYRIRAKTATWDTYIFESSGAYRGTMKASEQAALAKLVPGDHVIVLDAGPAPREQFWNGTSWVEGMHSSGSEQKQERAYVYPTTQSEVFAELGQDDRPMRVNDGTDDIFYADSSGDMFVSGQIEAGTDPKVVIDPTVPEIRLERAGYDEPAEFRFTNPPELGGGPVALSILGQQDVAATHRNEIVFIDGAVAGIYHRAPIVGFTDYTEWDAFSWHADPNDLGKSFLRWLSSAGTQGLHYPSSSLIGDAGNEIRMALSGQDDFADTPGSAAVHPIYNTNDGRQHLLMDRVLRRLTAKVLVNNSTTETDVIKWTIPANMVRAGTTFKIIVGGWTQNQITSGAWDVFVKLGSTTLLDFNLGSQAAARTGAFWIETLVQFYEVANASTDTAASGFWRQGWSNAAEAVDTPGNSIMAMDMTASQELKVSSKFATASATNTFEAHTAVIELISWG